MIFRHYRNWIPGLQTGAGRKISAALSSVIGLRETDLPSPDSPEESKNRTKSGT